MGQGEEGGRFSDERRTTTRKMLPCLHQLGKCICLQCATVCASHDVLRELIDGSLLKSGRALGRHSRGWTSQHLWSSCSRLLLSAPRALCLLKGHFVLMQSCAFIAQRNPVALCPCLLITNNMQRLITLPSSLTEAFGSITNWLGRKARC